MPDELRTNALHVVVDPIKPGGDWGSGVEVPSPIKGILLRSKSAPDSLKSEPSHLEVSDAQLTEKNRFEQSRATATIPIESVRALPAGDLQIVILTNGYDRRCDLGAKERLRIVR